MKDGWKYMKLGDCFISINNGANIKQVKGASGLPITRIETISNDTFNRDRLGYADITSKETFKKYELNDGDILMSHINSMKFLGRSVVYKKKDDEYIIHGMNLLRLVPKSDCHSEFMAYLFMTQFFREQLLTISHQSVNQASFNITALKGLTIPVPPLPEQQRIVEYLDTQFAKIEALKANAAKQLQAAKDLFQSALKDLMTPKEGWEEKTLGEICTHIVDCPHTTPKKATQKTNYPCIRTSELKNGTIFWDSMQYLDENEYLKRVTRLVPQADDIVYGREGTFGDAVLLPEGYKFSLGQRTMLLRPNQDIVIPKYLHYAIISPQVFAQAQEKNTGCGVPHVNVADVKQFKICYSSDILNQQNVVSQLDDLSNKIKALQSNYEQTITLCSDLKQSLLKQIFE